ncbi:hypothetical protein HJFPF1_00844 [Paramyrothecium foliicola]|nr:hypothetical protein HJFPF1_00844 [Paramyrothecium foliicola]
MPQPTTPARGQIPARLVAVEAAAARLEASQKSTIDRWLESPVNNDVSPVVSAVSELFSSRADSTMTSPATTWSSSVPSLYARKESLVSTYQPSPSSPEHSQTSWSQNMAGASGAHTGQPPRGSSANPELREVGAFAASPTTAPQRQQPRRQMRHKPLTTWFDLWLPQEDAGNGEAASSHGSTAGDGHDVQKRTTQKK